MIILACTGTFSGLDFLIFIFVFFIAENRLDRGYLSQAVFLF